MIYIALNPLGNDASEIVVLETPVGMNRDSAETVVNNALAKLDANDEEGVEAGLMTTLGNQGFTVPEWALHNS